MEELQVIETTSGRQFKPWASKEEVQAIRHETVQAVEQAVLNPASVTAITSEIASGKQVIIAAIEAMGGTADVTMSFAELADVIRALPAVSLVSTEGLSAVGAPVNLLKWLLNAKGDLDSNFTEINDNSILSISNTRALAGCGALQSVTMPSLTTITGDSAFDSCLALQSVTMPSLTTITGTSAFASCRALQSVTMPSLTTITGTSVFNSCGALQSVTMPSLTTITGTSAFNSCLALQRLYLPNLTTTAINMMRSSGIKEFICPKLTNLLLSIFYQCRLTNVVVGTLTSMGEPFTYDQPDLRNVTIGAETDINIPLQKWTGTNVSPTELNANIMANLVPNLKQDGGKTLRLGAALYDVLTTETKDAITDRGWTLQRG